MNIDGAVTTVSFLPRETTTSLITINVSAHAQLKLTSSNYVAWRAQFESLLVGYDLFGFVDGSIPCPPPTTTDPTTNITTSNPAHRLWIRQDKLVLHAIVCSLSPSLVPLIATKKTSLAAWTSLGKIFLPASRSRISELRSKLFAPQKGSRSIIEYMSDIRTTIDALALLNKPVDFDDDLSMRIMNGLDEAYGPLARTIEARDTPIEFEELFKELLNHEAHLNLSRGFALTAQPIRHLPHPRLPPPCQSFTSSNQYRHPRPSTLCESSHGSPRSHNNPRAPYLGKCQLCGVTGHTARQCSLVPTSTWDNIPSAYREPRPRARANTTTQQPFPHSTQDWVLDSGASHHITMDLANLSLQ